MSGRIPVESRWPAGTLMDRLGATGEELLALAPPVWHAPGTKLAWQGERRTRVYVLQPVRPESIACVKVTASRGDGNEALLGIRIGGDIVGELAALRDGQRTATVTTCTPTVVHAIAHDRFLGFLSRHPEGWEALCRMIADRLGWANRRRLDFAGASVPVRLARVLVELIDRLGRRTEAGYQLRVQMSQSELGRLIGAGEDAVGLAVRQMRDAGVLRSEYRVVTVLELALLRDFAQLPADDPISQVREVHANG